MNILELQDELKKQIELLHKDLNTYLNPFGIYAVLTNQTSGFSFSIENDEGQYLGAFNNFDKSEVNESFNDIHFKECKKIINSFKEL